MESIAQPKDQIPEMDHSSVIRVALVDDQALVRSGLAMVIDSQDDMQVVAEAGDGQQALNRLALIPTDVVLMDVRMPVMDGIETTEKIVASHFAHGVQPKIIVLTTFDLDEYVMSAIEAGASGFLLKDAPPDDLLTAIRTIHKGDAVIAPSSTKRLVAHIAASAAQKRLINPQLLDGLSERELQVLGLAARGKSNTEIAEELFLAEATIKTHVGRIFAKLGVRDRVQAVVVAFQAGLVKPGETDLD
ncbi:response regulator transcription factor [Arcanobacterium hippocoleae]|uniref:DNA-binding NarL/FixJ family response regulator n=1 Tax=Arcanobacterium hippocoleae TaxID=149017 RepID=A0ABU1T1F7_9ACTO|nr:response regulator transcription factor [Arcanobacterium hippocoleae]MDR6939209.1 DNA-binding NarL/FixJ family response regulator [Arcanobacterium hippocoleae]